MSPESFQSVVIEPNKPFWTETPVRQARRTKYLTTHSPERQRAAMHKKIGEIQRQLDQASNNPGLISKIQFIKTMYRIYSDGLMGDQYWKDLEDRTEIITLEYWNKKKRAQLPAGFLQRHLAMRTQSVQVLGRS